MKSSLYSHFHSHGLEGALDTGCRCELAKESQMKETLRLHPVCCPQISKGCYRGSSPAQKEAPRGKVPDLQEDEINSVAERSIYFSSYAVLGSQARAAPLFPMGILSTHPPEDSSSDGALRAPASDLSDCGDLESPVF